jgi:hypothetical protein
VARVAWLLRHQWRAYWRGVIREGNHVQFYLFVLTPLAYLIFIKLPPKLQLAAQDLSTGRTGSSEFILLLFAGVWLLLPSVDATLSMSVKNLLRFPLPIRELLALRILSLFISPLALLILLGSLLSLFPFFRARHPLPGLVAALLFFLLAMLLGWCLTHLLSIAVWRKGFLAVAVITIAPFGASILASGNQANQNLHALLPYTPAHLVTVAATGGRWHSVLIPLSLLLAACSLSPWLLGWSFRRNLSAVTEHLSAGGGKLGFIKPPGKLASLVDKEQRYYRKSFNPWIGLLLTLVCSFALLKNAIPPIILETAILFIFLFDLDLIINSFGWDRVPEINRYLLFPLRGRDIVLVKNLGIAIISAAQMLPLLLLAGWRFGWIIAGVCLIEVLALLLAHLAWGNLYSVGYPHKEHFYRLTSGGGSSNILIVIVGTVFGTLPGVAVIFLTQAGAGNPALKVSGILLLTIAGYLGSLYCAGRMFERRWAAILDRLS